jgi:hypothetical protein
MKVPKKSELCIILAFLVQLAMIGLLLFGSIGFDHPGSSGMDFEDGLIIAGFYGVALLFGIGGAYWANRPKLFCMQLIIPVSWFIVMIV